jgi:hypothetical protein
MQSAVRAIIVIGLMTSGPALAQFQPQPPELQNRVPPPPVFAPPPVINGPLGRAPPPGVYIPDRLNTFSDRVTSCRHEGAASGLRGRKLRAYATACANSN